ncbi:hypothetical protein B0T17DRAFT_599955 [Bombardia bombarda]|uniref:Uncharacterized protein n=1 Tax=Bombardia bombarda TaxID=252184 RepID=A0AA40C5I7_9PEZI|nr:hypothetical protein B0T17DRAFT_599955 [Bombardia bombarda]
MTSDRNDPKARIAPKEFIATSSESPAKMITAQKDRKAIERLTNRIPNFDWNSLWTMDGFQLNSSVDFSLPQFRNFLLRREFTSVQRTPSPKLQIDDLKLPIRVRNNVTVLFLAMLHFKSWFGHEVFWNHINRSIGCNERNAEVFYEVYLDGRRTSLIHQLGVPNRTAKLVDAWIGFLENFHDEQKTDSLDTSSPHNKFLRSEWNMKRCSGSLKDSGVVLHQQLKPTFVGKSTFAVAHQNPSASEAEKENQLGITNLCSVESINPVTSTPQSSHEDNESSGTDDTDDRCFKQSPRAPNPPASITKTNKKRKHSSSSEPSDERATERQVLTKKARGSSPINSRLRNQPRRLGSGSASNRPLTDSDSSSSSSVNNHKSLVHTLAEGRGLSGKNANSFNNAQDSKLGLIQDQIHIIHNRLDHRGDYIRHEIKRVWNESIPSIVDEVNSHLNKVVVHHKKKNDEYAKRLGGLQSDLSALDESLTGKVRRRRAKHHKLHTLVNELGEKLSILMKKVESESSYNAENDSKHVVTLSLEVQQLAEIVNKIMPRLVKTENDIHTQGPLMRSKVTAQQSEIGMLYQRLNGLSASQTVLEKRFNMQGDLIKEQAKTIDLLKGEMDGLKAQLRQR